MLENILAHFKTARVQADGMIAISAEEMRNLAEAIGLDIIARHSGNVSIAEACEIITPEEVCERLGISRQTLWRMRKTGRFIEPISITNRKIAFRRTDYAAWLSRGNA